jgi:hypothetical protein
VAHLPTTSHIALRLIQALAYHYVLAFIRYTTFEYHNHNNNNNASPHHHWRLLSCAAGYANLRRHPVCHHSIQPNWSSSPTILLHFASLRSSTTPCSPRLVSTTTQEVCHALGTATRSLLPPFCRSTVVRTQAHVLISLLLWPLLGLLFDFVQQTTLTSALPVVNTSVSPLLPSLMQV